MTAAFSPLLKAVLSFDFDFGLFKLGSIETLGLTLDDVVGLDVEIVVRVVIVVMLSIVVAVVETVENAVVVVVVLSVDGLMLSSLAFVRDVEADAVLRAADIFSVNIVVALVLVVVIVVILVLSLALAEITILTGLFEVGEIFFSVIEFVVTS